MGSVSPLRLKVRVKQKWSGTVAPEKMSRGRIHHMNGPLQEPKLVLKVTLIMGFIHFISLLLSMSDLTGLNLRLAFSSELKVLVFLKNAVFVASMWRLGLRGAGGGGESFPERPDEPDCIYFLRTGVCGYGSRCRFNHPRNRAPVINSLSLSSLCFSGFSFFFLIK